MCWEGILAIVVVVAGVLINLGKIGNFLLRFLVMPMLKRLWAHNKTWPINLTLAKAIIGRKEGHQMLVTAHYLLSPRHPLVPGSCRLVVIQDERRIKPRLPYNADLCPEWPIGKQQDSPREVVMDFYAPITDVNAEVRIEMGSEGYTCLSNMVRIQERGTKNA